MNIAFRVNGSPAIGLGHCMRCLALAEQFMEFLPVKIFFMINEDIPKDITERITKMGMEYLLLNSRQQENKVTDASTCINYMDSVGNFSLVVVDHYGLDIVWETIMREVTSTILVVDDLANRKHDCDLLLDQNLVENAEERYRKLVPTRCKLLLGPRYALLRRQFLNHNKINHLKVKCRNVLVNFGGSDPTKETVKVLDMIESTGSLFAEIQFTIVSGAANENQAYIESRCKALSNVNYINYAHNMAELLNSSDIAIGAGGISMLERAYIGIPSLVICIAKNQEQPIFEGERQGILVNLGHSSNVSADHIAVELKKLASSYEARDKMRSACFQIMGQAFESDIKRIVFKTINACEKRELRRMD